jgi:hypothetical protein
MGTDMRELFGDILNMEGVKGLLLFSFTGEVIFKEFNPTPVGGIESYDWSLFIEVLTGMRETDLIFDKGRLYIRRTDAGFLVVLIGPFVPIAMIRLQCDILLPALKSTKATRGIRRFFKK